MSQGKSLYADIAQKLKKKILTEEYVLNTILPTEKELAVIYDVSIITIRQAVEILVSEGFVEKRQGRGTRVISNQIHNSYKKIGSFEDLLREQNKEPFIENIALKEIELEKNHSLYPYFGGKCMNLSQIRYVDSQPYALVEYYFSCHYKNATIQDFNLQSVKKIFQSHRIRVSYLEIIDDIVPINFEQQKRLITSTTYCSQKTHVSYNDVGEVEEVSVRIYNLNQEKYKLRLHA